MTATTRTPYDVLRRAADEGLPLGPVHAATHSRLHEIEPGRCVASTPGVAGDEHLGPWVLADFVTGLAVTGTLSAGERITTLRLGLQMLGPPPAGGMRAVGEILHAGDGIAVSRAVVSDVDGRTVALASARNAVLHDDAGDTFDDVPAAFAPAPWSGAALLDRRPDGADGLVARPDPSTTNAAGVVQGGVLAALAVGALADGLGRRSDETTVTFLRAVPPGADVHAAVTVEHAGRRLRSGRVTLSDARGKPVVTASGIAYDAAPDDAASDDAAST